MRPVRCQGSPAGVDNWRCLPRSAGQLGRQPARRPRSLRTLSRYAISLPAAPGAVDYYSKVSAWGQLGNDQYGDCTCATAGHLVQTWAQEMDSGERVDTAGALDLYGRVNGGVDGGAVIFEVLKEWYHNGLPLAEGGANRIGPFVPVAKTHLNVLRSACWLFGGVYLGIEVPRSAPADFEAGKPWENIIPGDPIVGGHAVPMVGFDDQYIYIVTWGEVQAMSWKWWAAYGEEAWAILPSEFIKASKGITGERVDDLVVDMAAILRDLRTAGVHQ